jgi:hypothetical protein
MFQVSHLWMSDVRNIPCRRKWGEHYDNDLKSFIAEINYLTTRK